MVVDLGLEGRKNLVAGANKLDYHYRNVTPGRDFTWTVARDIRNVNEGELDPSAGSRCGSGRQSKSATSSSSGASTRSPWAPASSTPTAKRSCRYGQLWHRY